MQPHQPNRWDIEIEIEERQYICFFDCKKQQCPDLEDYQFPDGKFFVLEILYLKGLRNYWSCISVHYPVCEKLLYMHNINKTFTAALRFVKEISLRYLRYAVSRSGFRGIYKRTPHAPFLGPKIFLKNLLSSKKLFSPFFISVPFTEKGTPKLY